MAEPRSRLIDGMKFMWDGREYDTVEAATSAVEEYEKDNFETRIVEGDGNVEVYTRRIVTNVEIEGEAPI
jgi:hypothetical protein